MVYPGSNFISTRSLSFDYDSKRRSDTVDLVQSCFWASRIKCSDGKDEWNVSWFHFNLQGLSSSFWSWLLNPNGYWWQLFLAVCCVWNKPWAFFCLFVRFCHLLFYQKLESSKSRLSLGNFIRGESVGRFLVKLKCDFFLSEKCCPQNIVYFLYFVSILLIKYR